MKVVLKAVVVILMGVFVIGCSSDGNTSDDTPMETPDANENPDPTPTPTPTPDPVTEVVVPAGAGHELLSSYNFFEGDLKDLTPNSAAGVVPYDLNTALFSDHALKKRFIYVPKGSSAQINTTEVLDLPVGTVLIKTFYYDEGGQEDIIETRLLIRKSDGWEPEIYQWNTEQTEAERTIIGGTLAKTIEVEEESVTFNYLIPNKNQCANCHANDGKSEPIGPMVQNLNKDYTYSDGSENQIERWIAQGILEDSSASIAAWPKIDDTSASLEERARAYLAVNCSSCHRPEGSAANSGLYLGYFNDDDASLGIFKTPVAAGGGTGGFTYVINPGKADESILLYRMISSEIDERMPEIGRELPHSEGIELIRDWINSLEP